MVEEPTVAKHCPSNGDRKAVLLRQYYSTFVPLPKDREKSFQP